MRGKKKKKSKSKFLLSKQKCPEGWPGSRHSHGLTAIQLSQLGGNESATLQRELGKSLVAVLNAGARDGVRTWSRFSRCFLEVETRFCVPRPVSIPTTSS